MSSFCGRRFPYNHFIILFFVVEIILAKEHASQLTVGTTYKTLQKVKGSCKCGAFPNADPKPNEKPVMSEIVNMLKCSPASRETCRKHCLYLAEARLTEPSQLNKLCARLENVYELLLSAFYKLCDEPWRYGYITMNEPICCENGMLTDCLMLSFKDF